MNRELGSRKIKGFQSNNEARATGNFSRLFAPQRSEASDFPGLSAVKFPLKSADCVGEPKFVGFKALSGRRRRATIGRGQPHHLARPYGIPAGDVREG